MSCNNSSIPFRNPRTLASAMFSLKEHCAPKVFFLAPEQHQVPEVIGINTLWVERRAKHFFFLGFLDFQSFQRVPGPHVQLWSVARLLCNAILLQWVKPNCIRKKKQTTKKTSVFTIHSGNSHRMPVYLKQKTDFRSSLETVQDFPEHS